MGGINPMTLFAKLDKEDTALRRRGNVKSNAFYFAALVGEELRPGETVELLFQRPNGLWMKASGVILTSDSSIIRGRLLYAVSCRSPIEPPPLRCAIA